MLTLLIQCYNHLNYLCYSNQIRGLVRGMNYQNLRLSRSRLFANGRNNLI